MGNNEPVCIADEVPFEIPESWEWVRLSTVNEMYVGNSINETEKKQKYTGLNDGYYYIGTKDIEFNHTINYDNGVRIPYGLNKFRIARKNSILMCIEGGSAGKKIAFINQDICFGNKLCCFYSLGVNHMFLYHYLQCPVFQSVFKENTTGIIGGVSVNVLKGLYIPIPPIEEQKRIVDKLQELLPHIEHYDKNEAFLGKLNTNFRDQLKKSILQEAIQGKLVPQNPNDEPASVLLKRIREEKQRLIKEGKIKKDKHESVIFRRDNSYYEKLDGIERCIDNETPFEIPSSWEWVRLGTIYQHNTGKTLNSANCSGKLMTYITTSNLYWNRFEIDSLRKMYFSESDTEKYTVTKGDLLVCEGGDIGRAAVWSYDTDIRIQNHIHRLRSYIKLCTEFYYYIFYLYKHAGWIGGKGIGIQGLSSTTLHSLLLPLPPLEEQTRITKQINLLFSSLKTL